MFYSRAGLNLRLGFDKTREFLVHYLLTISLLPVGVLFSSGTGGGSSVQCFYNAKASVCYIRHQAGRAVRREPANSKSPRFQTPGDPQFGTFALLSKLKVESNLPESRHFRNISFSFSSCDTRRKAVAHMRQERQSGAVCSGRM